MGGFVVELRMRYTKRIPVHVDGGQLIIGGHGQLATPIVFRVKYSS